MAWLTIPGLIGPIVGPPFGGFLTTFFSWHWIFLINVPIGVLGIVLVTRFLPEFKRNAPRAMDFPGFVLAGTAFAGWVFGVSVLTLPALPPVYGIVTLVAGTLAAAIYVWHAFRIEHPVLDLRLFRFPLFRTSVVAGTFFRLGVGGTPLLFPLMLQLVFGLSAFESGMVTFAGAVGALAAKFAAERVLEVFGFRTSLVWATLVTALGIFAMGVYDALTPSTLIIAILIVAGFFQSIFWTASNAFTFADIDDKDSGGANVISQVMVQISLAFGVALGGGALEASTMLRGATEATLLDFHIAFYVIGAVTLVSTVMFFFLPKDAGQNISGHGMAKTATDEPLAHGK
jgi:MFS family permease